MSIALSFIQLAADEGKETAVEQLEKIQLSLETVCGCGSVSERRYAASLLDSIRDAFHHILESNAVDIAREKYEYLDLDEPFVKGDEAIERGMVQWFPVVDSVGSSLRANPKWAIARRIR